jgi:uncharacterized membrane protein YccC
MFFGLRAQQPCSWVLEPPGVPVVADVLSPSTDSIMAPSDVYHLAEIDQMIERLRADLRDISERAASADGNASEERLADMLAAQEARLQDLLAKREEILAKADKGGRDAG